MPHTNSKMTTAQFAKLHKVNKRTLHYYDNIGLFSPSEKGDNGYRYYDISQSIQFENILMLKEMQMSIDTIADYCTNPSTDRFLEIAEVKEVELNLVIQKLKRTKEILKAKKRQILLCKELQDCIVRIEECNAVQISLLPYEFLDDDISKAFDYIKDKWDIEQIRLGVGSYISLDKVMKHSFQKYDGIYSYTLTNTSSSDTSILPKGKYLCGYQRGNWDRAPAMYEKMINYAKTNNLLLTGYAYEIGLNEFAISSSEEYVTKFMIQIQENRVG